jgi:hypothetical protein
MPPNVFDQACRYLARRDPVGLLCWLLRLTLAQLGFERWLDTRTVTFPGQPERICDTVAHVREEEQGGIPWALVLEFQLTPDTLMFGRLMVYLGHVWLEFKPVAERGDRFQVGAIVVNLTGRGNSSCNMQWAKAELATNFQVVDRNLEEADAPTVLAGVAAGTISSIVLALIPLMQRGNDPDTIKQWLLLASAEKDAQRRADHGLAQLFAEAVGQEEGWQQALKGWNMIQSKVVAGWKAEAKAEGMAEALVEALETKFAPVPAEVTSVIRGQTDLAVLKRWMSLAVQAVTLDRFRHDAQL